MAKSKVVAEIEKVWVEVLSPVLHDGEQLVIGAVEQIEKLAAEALVKIGAAKLATKPAAEPPQA